MKDLFHRLPVCFARDGVVSHDAVFAPLCEHEDCPSVVWHPICRMEFIDNVERRRQDLGHFLEGHRIVGLIVEPTDGEPEC